MSAPLAGKFQDHYEVLGLDPKADAEAIRQAYERLAKEHEGDKDKAEAVSLAFEVLSDPELRRDFNKLKGINTESAPKFSGVRFFEGLEREGAIRMAILCILYDRRRTKIYTPSLPYRLLEQMLAATQEEMAFALWYLKQKSLVGSDDKSSLQITVMGIDYLEARKPPPEVVMPVIRPSAMEVAPPASAPPGPSAAAQKGAGIVELLRRVGAETVRP